jgi:hypothetical protein
MITSNSLVAGETRAPREIDRAHDLSRGRFADPKNPWQKSGRMAPRAIASSLVGVVGLAVSWGARAHGAESARGAVALTWEAGAGCPAKAEVESAIRDVVGSGGGADSLRARVVVAPSGDAWRAEVVLSRGGETSTRTVDGDSCASVTDAVTVIVALAADPSARAAEPEARGAPPDGAATDRLARAEGPPAKDSPRRFFFAGASLLVDGAMLPSTDAGPEIVLGYRPRHVRLEIDGALLAPERATLAASASEGANFWLVHAGARGCWIPLEGAVDLGPCAGTGLDVVSAQGFGARSTSSATGAFATSFFGAMATVRLGERLALRLEGGAHVPIERPTFVIEGTGLVHRVPVASLRASAGVELHFP